MEKAKPKKKDSAAKDQHFLPQFYLANFMAMDTPEGQDPCVWVFDIQQARWRRRAPKNIAHLRHYYSYEEESGALVNVIDQNLTAVEGLGARLIRNLLRRQKLDEREQIHFGLFIAQLALRTPRNEQRVKEFNKLMGDAFTDRMIAEYRRDPALFERHKKNYEAKFGRPLTLSVDDLDRHRPRLVANKPGLLGQMFLPLERLLGRLLEMQWIFYYTPDDQHLVISDDPCEAAFPEDVAFNGVLTEGMELHVPIAKNLIFTAHDGDGSRSWGMLPADAVADLNQRMAWRAHKFIISSNEGFVGDEIIKELVADDERREKGWERRVVLHSAVEERLRDVAQKIRWKTDGS